jgi:hypothetical protein
MGYPTEKVPARVIIATTRVDPEYLQETEDKLTAIGDEVVDMRARGWVPVSIMADPDLPDLAAGTVVALRGSNGPGGVPIAMAATAANVAAGALPVGLLVDPTPAGQVGRVAIAGVVPVGLVSVAGVLANKLVRANSATGLAEAVTATALGDVLAGRRNADGAIRVRPRIQVGAGLTIKFAGAGTLTFARDADGMDVSASVVVTRTGTGVYTVVWTNAGLSATAAQAAGQSAAAMAAVSSLTGTGCTITTKTSAGVAADDITLVQVF